MLQDNVWLIFIGLKYYFVTHCTDYSIASQYVYNKKLKYIVYINELMITTLYNNADFFRLLKKCYP